MHASDDPVPGTRATSPDLAAQAAAAAAGLAYGAAYLKAGLDQPWVAAGAPSAVVVEGVLHLAMLPLLLWMLQRVCAQQVLCRLPADADATRYRRLEPWTFLVWPAAAAALGPLGATPAWTIAALVLQLALQAVVFGASLAPRARRTLTTSGHYIAGLFLVSGFAALIYQVVWQRILFTQFGVNSESVTAIVSVFMFGLGVGAVGGGWLLQRFPDHLLRIFVAIECGIGLYGLVSVPLIEAVSPVAEPTMPGLVARAYAVLAWPTLLMGATLPVLVAHLQKSIRHIGRTVSLLYALNTFGSAFAAFASVQVLFVLGGLRASLAVAVVCNFATAWLVWGATRHLERAPAGDPPPPQAAPALASAWTLPYGAAAAALAAVGFLSLSLEILWFRLLGFMTASRPEVFGMLLAVYLAGIGWGALRPHRLALDDRAARVLMVRRLVVAAALTFLAMPLTGWVSALAGKAVAQVVAYGAAGLVAFCCGGVFPTVIQLGTRDSSSNAALPVAWLYFANIAGSALGPLVTGFLLLDRLGLGANLALFAGLTLLLALALAGRLLLALPRRVLAAGAAAVVAAAIAQPLVYAGALESLLYGEAGHPPFRHVLEDRSAILAVEAADSDIMYGHGIYDGRFNIDPVRNSNLIDRAYLGAALHPGPRRVLEIGLSTGSWTRVLSLLGTVQDITVVEIGRSYPGLVALYPQTAPVLADPRIRIHLDDGRRWLKNHPNERFDFILMNTTFPWRSNTTNLLSREFLELARAHLRPGGVLYYNALGSDHVAYTAAHVFRHVTRYSTFVAASDAPLAPSPAERRERLLRFRGTGEQPLFLQDPGHRARLEQLANAALPDERATLLARRDLWLITDDNMATEFKVRY